MLNNFPAVWVYSSFQIFSQTSYPLNLTVIRAIIDYMLRFWVWFNDSFLWLVANLNHSTFK